MGVKQKFLLIVALFISILNPFYSYAQEQNEPADSLVRLIEAKSAKLKEVNGVSFREIIGPAKFLHNKTYLLCDSAYWNVATNIIDALGNIQIIQETTTLKSDRLEYYVDMNVAQFRGDIVELFDNEGNILRTNFLDYNTKDSSGRFFNGGVLLNSDGNLIESNDGTYNSREKLFTFSRKVEMFTDSTFIKSDKVDYRTDLNIAYLGNSTIAWQGENILTANSGEFQRSRDILLLNKDSYILSPEQELWADNLTYFRLYGNANLKDNVQMIDTVQSVIALSDRADYISNPMSVKLTEDPVIALYTYEKGRKDTLFARADMIHYYTKKFCDIDSSVVAQCNERRELSDLDPISQIDKKSQATIAKIEERLNYDPSKPPVKSIKKDTVDNNLVNASKDLVSNSLDIAKDSLVADNEAIKDSLSQTIVEKDTTKVLFLEAFNNVKFFREDFQGRADSLVYVGIDSIARFYKKPILWNGPKNQFTADSMQIVVKNKVLSKANLLTNAFIISQEDSAKYNQIKSPEMVAYFAQNELAKFDALGGVSAIFYFGQQDSVITEMNQKESKMLQVKFKDREVQSLKYIEQIKNDVYPLFNLAPDKQKLRGFEWRADERPLSRNHITTRGVRESVRKYVESKDYPNYAHAKKYFPQKRDSIFIYKAKLDSIALAKLLKREEELKIQDSLSIKKDADSLAIADKSKLLDDNVDAKKLSDTLSTLDTLAQLESEIEQKNNRIDSIKQSLKSKDNNRLNKRDLRKERRGIKREIRELKKRIKAVKKSREHI